MSNQLVSALQEFLRTFVQGMLIPLGAASSVIVSGIDTTNGGFHINWMLALAIITAGAVSALHTALVAALDKYLHKSGIETPLDFRSLDNLKG